MAPLADPTVPPRRARPGLRAFSGRAARALIAVGMVAFFVAQSFYDHAADFKTFYSAGYAIRHPEVPLYDLVALDDNPFGEVFKLPPSAAVYLAPLSLMSLQDARLAWRLALVAALFGGYTLLLRSLRVPALSWGWLAGLGLWALFGPAQIAVGEGQWDAVFLLLIVVAVAGVRASRPLLSGLALGLAGSIKPYPVLIAGFFLARRWWGGLAVTGLTTAVLIGAGALIAGADATTAFVTRVLPASAVTTPYVDNQALGGVLARVASDDFKPLPLRGMPWVDWAVRVSALAALSLTAWVVGRRPAADPDERTLQFCLFVPLSILVVPAAWTHYATILLVPLTVLAVDLGRRNQRAWAAWCALAFAFVLLAIPNPTMLYGGEVDRALWLRGRADAANTALQRAYPTELARLLFSYKALAVAIVYGALAWRVVRAPMQSRAALSPAVPPRHAAPPVERAPTLPAVGS